MSVLDHAHLDAFIRSTPWAKRLTERELDKVLSTSVARRVHKGEAIIRATAQAQAWVGLIKGFAVQSVTHSDGSTTFLSAATDGAWFGEGTLIKRGNWMYDAIALRETTAAYVPLATFEFLRSNSMPFNHFLQVIMNDRLAHFIGLAVTARQSNLIARVSRALANLFDPVLYSPADAFVRITQTELGMLAGVSRQHANIALARLRKGGIIKTGHQGIEVRDLDALRAFAAD